MYTEILEVSPEINYRLTELQITNKDNIFKMSFKNKYRK